MIGYFFCLFSDSKKRTLKIEHAFLCALEKQRSAYAIPPASESENTLASSSAVVINVKMRLIRYFLFISQTIAPTTCAHPYNLTYMMRLTDFGLFLLLMTSLRQENLYLTAKHFLKNAAAAKQIPMSLTFIHGPVILSNIFNIVKWIYTISGTVVRLTL